MKLPSRVQWNQVILCLLIGFAIGTAFGQWNAKECASKHWKKGGMKQHLLNKFTKELQLNDEQKTKVAAIFETTHSQMAALHAQVKPQFEALRTTTQDEIRKILTEDQQKKFDVMNKKMEERWKKRNKFFDS